MRRARTVVLRLTALEARHLGALVTQFTDLLAGAEDAAADRAAAADPAIGRLLPDAYRDDPDAAREFREVTADGLLERRRHDAAMMLTALAGAADATDDDAETPYPVELGPAHLDAWLRTLAALRLVLASRLGIDTEDDHAPGDPRYGIYDWIGFRLEGLVRAATD